MGIIEKQSVQDIANAIRNRNGLTTLYKPREMDEAILNLYSTTKVNNMLDYILPCYEKEATDYTIKYADADRPCSISKLEGNTTQNGTPTPTSPVEVSTVSGDNNIVVCGKNKFNKNKAQIGKAWNNTSNTARAIVITKVEPNTKYTISFQSITGLELWWFGRASENDSTRTDGNYQITTSPTTITTNATTNYLGLQFNKTSIAQSDIDNCNLQIEKSSQATTYEPYIGNSYRVDLKSKQLFDENNVLNAYIDANGYVLTSNASMRVAYTPCEPNTTYTISKVKSARFILATYSSLAMGSTSTNGRNDSNATSLTITTDSNAKYLCVFYYHTSDTLSEQEIRNSIMINKGSTALPYESYYDYELCKIGNYVDKLKRAEGKNLFDRANAEENKGLVWTTGATFNDTNSIVSDYMIAEIGQDYKFNYNGGIFFYDSNKDYLGALQSGGTTIAKTTGTTTTVFAVPNVSEIKYMRIAFRSAFNNNANMVTANISINEGTTVLPYEPYGVGTWYIEKNIGKVVLNGQRVYISTLYNDLFYIMRTDLGINYKLGGYCDKLKFINNNSIIDNDTAENNLTTNQVAFRLGNSKDRVYIKTNIATTASELQTWLSNNNATLYYVLSTPTYETITNENLINQLNNIQNIELIENLCYVDWVGEEKPTMKLFCYLDKDKIIEEITG